MYFSRVTSKDITFDDPESWCMRIHLELYDLIEGDYEKLMRVVLDTPFISVMMMIRNKMTTR